MYSQTHENIFASCQLNLGMTIHHRLKRFLNHKPVVYLLTHGMFHRSIFMVILYLRLMRYLYSRMDSFAFFTMSRSTLISYSLQSETIVANS